MENNKNKVLVVDDDYVVRTVLKKILLAKQYTVYEAENGHQALEVLTNHNPDCVICDIMMPEIDGLEILKRAKSDTNTASIPFIFLTSSTGLNNIMVGISEGAVDYITKPFRNDRVIEAVEKVLGA